MKKGIGKKQNKKRREKSFVVNREREREKEREREREGNTGVDWREVKKKKKKGGGGGSGKEGIMKPSRGFFECFFFFFLEKVREDADSFFGAKVFLSLFSHFLFFFFFFNHFRPKVVSMDKRCCWGGIVSCRVSVGVSSSSSLSSSL